MPSRTPLSSRIQISGRLLRSFVAVKSSCTKAYTAVSLLLAPCTRPKFESGKLIGVFRKLLDLGFSLSLILILVLAAGWSWTSAESQTQQSLAIKLWVRKAGDYENIENPNLGRVQHLTITATQIRQVHVRDPQYSRAMNYKGLYLQDILAGFQGSDEGDAVLLHFRNRMLIPLSRQELFQSSKVFVAFAYKTGRGWSRDFPQIARYHPDLRDPFPITFQGNKVAFLGAESPKPFNPWQHVDSLVGIEIIDSWAYYRQFPGAIDEKFGAGFAVFQQRCQYCHGVRQIGARFGWDFAGPIPAYQKRDPRSLYYHVSTPKMDAFQLGTQMPPQVNLTREETRVLWDWLQYAAKKERMTEYRPR